MERKASFWGKVKWKPRKMKWDGRKKNQAQI